jgi:hypothetical protein
VFGVCEAPRAGVLTRGKLRTWSSRPKDEVLILLFATVHWRVVCRCTEFRPRSSGLETIMTEAQDIQIIHEAVSVIDGALNDFLHRELVSSNEITDILLDVRTLLSKKADESPEPVSG